MPGNLWSRCAYGQLFFPILETVFPKLSPIHGDYVQSVKTEDNVDVLLAKTFVRHDMFSRRPLHFFSRCSYSNLCRTVSKQDGSVREATRPVISQAPRVVGLSNYEKRSQPANPFIFCAALRGTHRKARNELEGVTQLLILPLLV